MQISSGFGGAGSVPLPQSLSTGDAPYSESSAITTGRPVDDFVDSVVVNIGGRRYEGPLLSSRVPEVEAEVKLPEAQAPKLARPVLFLHGFMGVAREFDEISQWLSREGQNTNGGIIRADQLDKVDSKANLFALEFSKPYNEMATNAGEIKVAVEAICKATGSDSIDIVAHSKGGLDARTYLMDADERVDQVVTVGTPHKGSPLANLELFVREELGRPIKPPIKDPVINRSLRELTVDDTDKRGRPHNGRLHELNNNWDVQSDRAEFMAIAGSGVLTITEPGGLSWKGDGVVSRKSASAADEAVKGCVDRTRHGALPQNAKVMQQIASFLTGERQEESQLAEAGVDGSSAANTAAQQEVNGYIVS